jgi:hypothetical protein
MADFYPLIARSVASVERNTGAARRAVYESARAALATKLIDAHPSIVVSYRLELEEAIRKVEAESLRSALSKLGTPKSVLGVQSPDPRRWEAVARWDSGNRARLGRPTK